MNENNNLVPFDSFSAINKVLFWAGYSKLDNRTEIWKQVLYEIYRRLALTIVIIYNLQSIIYTLQSRDDIKKMTESLTVGIPFINLFVKCLTLFFLDTRLQKLNEFLKDGIFCVTNEADQKTLQKSVMQMHRLSQIMNINTSVTAFFWGFCSILKRYIYGEYDVVQMYFPYRTDTAFRFFLLLLNQIGPMLWVGNGHTSIDILIATYYAQAHTQLKIIRQQLNNLVEETPNNRVQLNYGFRYKYLSDKSVKERFISVVKRHGTLMWYVREVDSIFNIAISFQFLSSAVTVCFVIYGITTVRTSFQFIFLTLMFFFLTTQIFLYCICGNFVFVEVVTYITTAMFSTMTHGFSCSQFLNDSLYECDWLSLSPSFRRLLLVAMVMWSQPVQPKVCRVLRLSLSTFLSITLISTYSVSSN